MKQLALKKDAIWLEAEANHGYGLTRIPSKIDKKITTLMDQLRNMTVSERTKALQYLSEGQARVLNAFAERMAIASVRYEDPSCIFYGSIALLASTTQSDARDTILILALLHDASERLELQPTVVFEETSSFSPDAFANTIVPFLLRSKEDKSITAMGYRVEIADDGFSYARTW